MSVQHMSLRNQRVNTMTADPIAPGVLGRN